MDAALFVPYTQETAWARELLPGACLSELPVAGRRYIDCALECARRFHIALAEVLDWSWSDDLRRDFAEPERGECPVFYEQGRGEPPRGLADIEGYDSPLTQNIDDGLVVAWGLVLATGRPEDAAARPVGEEEKRVTPPGLYRRENGGWVRLATENLEIRDAASWLDVNLRILGDSGFFTLPGYSAEKGVHLGRNTVMEHGTEVKPPVILSDNTWCGRNVLLDGGVIVGKGSFIGPGTRLSRTVVCPGTYLGDALDLEDKIAAGRRIIDAKTGAWTDIEEPGVARGIGGAPALGWLRAVWRFMLGASRGRRR